MEWINVTDQEPPKNRVIMITSGFAWRRVEVPYPALRNTNGKIVRPARKDSKVKASGAVMLARWFATDDWRQFPGGMWIEPASNNVVPQDFQFWSEYDNPLDPSEAAKQNALTGLEFPDIDTMEISDVPYHPFG